jgi:succinate-semialdehyde dehydrogenase / glutarate-semialdehyde dehydrogenase
MADNYPKPTLFIDGAWRGSSDGALRDVFDPATGQAFSAVPVATSDDVAEAAEAAARAFAAWRATSALDRSHILRRAAMLMRERARSIGQITTREQGKLLSESTAEAMACADVFDWYAEEGRRAYGRIIPSKHPGVRHMVLKEPIGPVAAFSPWNFPTTIPSRKLAAALAAGCPVVIKPAEETPGSAIALARCLDDAGLPKGVLNVVFGEPAKISSQLIADPAIRKISFTGSTIVGKQLARLAADQMIPTTLELGGHAPVLIFADADIDRAAATLVGAKYRNAGQICITPTRFYVHESVHDAFVERFAAIAANLTIGNGLDPASKMGPLANPRRLSAMYELSSDAERHGGKLVTGGAGQAPGNFWHPTVISDVSNAARVMNEEPFGPLAVTQRFATFDEAIAEANRLPYGLAAFAWTQSARTAHDVSEAIEAGMIGINFNTMTGPETPFGGLKESGHGSEGGSEGLEAYLVTKYVAAG